MLQFLQQAQAPRRLEQIAANLNIRNPADIQKLAAELAGMAQAGQILITRIGEYGLARKMDLISGRVSAHPDGYGFVLPDAGTATEDVFLPATEMRSLLHGDRVLVRVTGRDRRGRQEGALVDVLARANTHIVGRYEVEANGIGFVIPENVRISQDILIPKGDAGAARAGQMVVAAIVAQPDRQRQPVGRITEVLGAVGAPGMEIDVAIRSFNIPHVWPAAVLAEIAPLAGEVSAAEQHGRLDLRALPFVTIDGEDARDFDDAVYAERTAHGYKLYVAIADVSHYVRHHTALDAEAQARGTSVYFPQHVVPMLPEVLSNGLCSLNPHVDRLCLVCELHFDARGVRQSYTFHEAVFHSQARLTYTQVANTLVQGDPALHKKHPALTPHLQTLYELYQQLRKQRDQRGAIDFESQETRILFNAERKIEEIVPVVRNEAHMLIEECMIAANIAAAEFLLTNKVPAVYRVHDKPTAEKLEKLKTFLQQMGLHWDGKAEPTPKNFSRLLEGIKDRPDAGLIQTVLLRSLKLAVYTPENRGHFGLALDAYTHFTSPIRRYPDLMVHRAIRHILSGRRVAGNDPATIEQLAEQCSMTERRADDATRDVNAWLKCEYMQSKVGEEFDGIISGVTGFGLFVTINNIHVDGLVHISTLPGDYYHFDPVGHRLQGERSGRAFRLGDVARVRVARVDLAQRKIDFDLLARHTGTDPLAGGAAPRKKDRQDKKYRR